MKPNNLYLGILVISFKCIAEIFTESYSQIHKKCENGIPYKSTLQLRITGNGTETVVFNNASKVSAITIIIMPVNCCAEVFLHDCNSGLDINMTLCNKTIHNHEINLRHIHPGDTYILSFNVRNKCKNGITFVVLKLTDIPVKHSGTIVTTTGDYVTSIQPSRTTTATNHWPNTSQPENRISDLITNKINSLTSGNNNFYTDNHLSGIHFHQDYLTSSQEANIGESNMAAFSATAVLPYVTPLNTSFDTPIITSTISLRPTNVNQTISNSFTEFNDNSTESSDTLVSTTEGVTTVIYVKNDKGKKDTPNATIALGITIALFALAVIVISFMIIRVLYKTRKDIHINSEDNLSVFCSNDFVMQSPGFINEVPTAVAKPDFIKIRKVSDSTTDEMTEIDGNRYTRHDESLHVGSYTKHNPDSRYFGLTGVKKYPAPQPSKSSNYIANRNSRLNSYQSDSDYSQNKRH